MREKAETILSSRRRGTEQSQESPAKISLLNLRTRKVFPAIGCPSSLSEKRKIFSPPPPTRRRKREEGPRISRK